MYKVQTQSILFNWCLVFLICWIFSGICWVTFGSEKYNPLFGGMMRCSGLGWKVSYQNHRLLKNKISRKLIVPDNRSVDCDDRQSDFPTDKYQTFNEPHWTTYWTQRIGKLKEWLYFRFIRFSRSSRINLDDPLCRFTKQIFVAWVSVRRCVYNARKLYGE